MTGIIPPLVSLKRHRPEGFSHTDASPIVFKCERVCKNVCVCVCVCHGEVEMLKCASVWPSEGVISE